jgi:hypothetical protein
VHAVRCAAAAAVAAVALAALPGPAAATPSEDLERARDDFRRGAYTDAIPLLTYLLYPKEQLSQSNDLVEAHVLLGVCQFETGDKDAATREFDSALFLSSSLTLDKKMFSDAVVRFFDDAKQARQDQGRRDAERRALAEEKDRLRKYRESLVVYEVRPYYVNFIPFGAGQFQNGQRTKGLWFASTEATTGALSAGIWLYLVGTYGFNGRVPTSDANFARRLQQVEIGAGGVCLGLMAWGIVDSLLHYRPRARVQGDDTLLPPDLRPAKSPRSSFHLGPALVPGGAGITLTWEH